MREIKYRGKRIDNGEWVIGFFVKNRDGSCWIKDTDYNVNDGKCDLIPVKVIPETVDQFTGLKDNNGVEIYEGDILDIGDGNPVKVRYEKIYASFGIWRKGWAFLHYFHEAVEPENCEVIGNIHNNP